MVASHSEVPMCTNRYTTQSHQTPQPHTCKHVLLISVVATNVHLVDYYHGNNNSTGRLHDTSFLCIGYDKVHALLGLYHHGYGNSTECRLNVLYKTSVT